MNTKKPPFYRWLNRLLKTALKKTITNNSVGYSNILIINVLNVKCF